MILRKARSLGPNENERHAERAPHEMLRGHAIHSSPCALLACVLTCVLASSSSPSSPSPTSLPSSSIQVRPLKRSSIGNTSRA